MLIIRSWGANVFSHGNEASSAETSEEAKASCVFELAGRKHVALLRFLTFSYSPLRLPVVHLRVLVSWYFIFIIAVAPHMKIPVDTILFHKMLKEKTKTKKPRQDSEWINVGQRSPEGKPVDRRRDYRAEAGRRRKKNKKTKQKMSVWEAQGVSVEKVVKKRKVGSQTQTRLPADLVPEPWKLCQSKQWVTCDLERRENSGGIPGLPQQLMWSPCLLWWGFWNDLGETLLGQRATWCQDWRMPQGSSSGNLSRACRLGKLSPAKHVEVGFQRRDT